MQRAFEQVEKGNDFGEAFDAANVFPQEFIDAVRVGELSGTETESFDRLASQYQERSKASLGRLQLLPVTRSG